MDYNCTLSPFITHSNQTYMNDSEVISILKECKNVGVKTLEYRGLKVEFHLLGKEDYSPHSASAPPDVQAGLHPLPPIDLHSLHEGDQAVELEAKDLVKPMSILDEMSAEEILFYATPRYDEIQAEKEAHKQSLETK